MQLVVQGVVFTAPDRAGAAHLSQLNAKGSSAGLHAVAAADSPPLAALMPIEARGT